MFNRAVWAPDYSRLRVRPPKRYTSRIFRTGQVVPVPEDYLTVASYDIYVAGSVGPVEEGG